MIITIMILKWHMPEYKKIQDSSMIIEHGGETIKKK